MMAIWKLYMFEENVGFLSPGLHGVVVRMAMEKRTLRTATTTMSSMRLKPLAFSRNVDPRSEAGKHRSST